MGGSFPGCRGCGPRQSWQALATSTVDTRPTTWLAHHARPRDNRAHRIRTLKEVIRHLHQGQAPAEVNAMAGLVKLAAGLLGNRGKQEIRQRGYQEQRAMAWILIATMIALSLVTALGIVGMASFWVTQRIKQIGTRRALAHDASMCEVISK
ncbi:MAG: hypothetical protein HC802_09260 [Caldilineaceae bacterium]|nr:hypothetical protein [Caldilineaceae bacterium]